jgi:hypothetical protein
MIPSLPHCLVFLILSLTTLITAQSTAAATSGYVGYDLTLTGDPNSAVYDTASTAANVSTTNPPPDVFLNATVHVGEIDIVVSNLTAEINLSAQVLSLLTFNAGVDVSIDRVNLQIQNVSAHVLLEARLENLVLMINDTLNSIDLNPIIATLGQDVGTIVNDTVGAVTGAASTVVPRSFDLVHNILFSVNDYSGNTHTNRILTQSGSIVDQSLDNDGNVHSTKVVGSFLTDMTFNGFNHSVVRDGQVVTELEYVYTPFNGLSVVSAIFINATDAVIATQVLSESSAGGSSTISDL